MARVRANQSLEDQRAARRLRKKRTAGAIASKPSHNVIRDEDCHCHDDNNDDGDNNKSSNYTSSKPTQELIQNSSSSTCSGSGDYITAFTSITEKYPHHFHFKSDRDNNIMKSQYQYDDDRMSPIFNLQFNHKRQQLSKRELGIKLVQNQWRNGWNSPSSLSMQHGGRNCRQRTNSGHYHTTMDSHENNNDTDEESIQQMLQCHPTSTLVYRKPNIDYTSNSAEYQNIKYISDHTVVAVDSRGHLDFVGLPLHHTTTASCSTTLNVQSNNEDDSRRFGVGTHLARVPIAPPSSSARSRISHLGKHEVELYPYAQGEKIAVGLPSGQVRLFASERLDVLDSSSTSGGTDTHRLTVGGECTNPHAIWSCLPSSITSLGPKRRYTRSSQYGLKTSSMITSMLTIPKREDLPESFSNLEYSEEVTNWNSEMFLFERKQNHYHHCDALWAFREGGVSSNSALIGAFVDPELDCFSLRQFDERVANGCTTSSAVFVDKSCKEKCNGDEVSSICFTGEFGLVTNHNVDPNQPKKKKEILKFWDQRMLLGHQPVSKVNLVFPLDDVHGVLPSAECVLNYGQGGNNSRSRQSSGVSLLPFEMGFDASSSSQSKTNIKVSNLIGSNDGSDLFAMSLVNSNTKRDEGLIIVDSSRREVVEEAEGANLSSVVKSSCLSSNLDFVAYHELRANENGDYDGAADYISDVNYISLFDISRYKSNSARDSYSNKIEERKRKEPDDTDCSHSRCLATIRPKFTDVYGIASTISCMTMSEFGSSIACGTSDGDIFILGGN